MSRVNEIIRRHEAKVAVRREVERLARRMTEHVEQIPPAPEVHTPSNPLASNEGIDWFEVKSKKTGKVSIVLIASMPDAKPEPVEDVYRNAFLVRRPIPLDLTPALLPKRPPTIRDTGIWGLLLAVDYLGKDFAEEIKRMGYRTTSAVHRVEKRLQRARKRLSEHLAKSS